MKPKWMSRTVIGILLTTFFSDVGHEMVTAVLPLYLASVAMGATTLGVMEGVADLFAALAKLGGGYVGHRSERKHFWGSLGYLVTSLAITSIAWSKDAFSLVCLRTIAWTGRGFRSPLRDFLLSDAVEPSHFGRVYGIERSADMLGAVGGPLLAVLFTVLGLSPQAIILVSFAPSFMAAAAFFFLTEDRGATKQTLEKKRDKHEGRDKHEESERNEAFEKSDRATTTRLPRAFWFLLIGVLLFGLGDFSRSFLILFAVRAFSNGSLEPVRGGALSLAVLLYATHNVVSAITAAPVGRLADRYAKWRVLVSGYVLGTFANGLLAMTSSAHTTSVSGLIAVVVLSGIYVAIEETVEKATVAEILPRDQRSLGLGILACANGVGDMASSLYMGVLVDRGKTPLALAIATGFGALGAVWMGVARSRISSPSATTT